MKLLLVQNMLYVPAHGGANTSNRRLMEDLAAMGHTCRVVTPAVAPASPVESEAAFHETLRDRGIKATPHGRRTHQFRLNGVDVVAVTPPQGQPVLPDLYRTLKAEAETFEPTWILVSAEHDGHVCLEGALEACPDRVVTCAHTVTAFPCGPVSAAPSPDAVDLMKQAAAVVTVSRFAQTYLKTWGDIDATVLPIASYGSGPFPRYGTFREDFVTMINPCAVKGIDLFLALADRFPDVDFAAVPTWGTTAADRAALGRRPNVTIRPPVDDVDTIYADTHTLVMPSLWPEILGRCATEAMLRGIPVLASDYAGLPEAKFGVDYLLPVRPITALTGAVDDRRRAQPTVPDQDAGPWIDALERLLTDRSHYDALSETSRAVATEGIAALTTDAVESFLLDLRPTTSAATTSGGDATESAETLSGRQRALLAMRALKQKTASDAPVSDAPVSTKPVPPTSS